MTPSEYEKLLILQYSDKPKASGMISAIVSRFKSIFDTISQFESSFDLDSAVGEQLDIIGKIVGISRNVEGVIPKIFFGFDGFPNSDGFGLASFYTLDQSKYTDTQLTDSDYRFFIRLKIAKNHAKATMLDDDGVNLNAIVFNMFNGFAYLTDNKDMTVILYVENSPKAYLLPYAISLDLIPLPQAVGIKFVSTYGANTFGFSNNLNAVGFGLGQFSKIMQI